MDRFNGEWNDKSAFALVPNNEQILPPRPKGESEGLVLWCAGHTQSNKENFQGLFFFFLN